MKQALHIFRKDVRRLTYEICVLVALTIAWTWAAIGRRADFPMEQYATIAALVLVLGWFYVVSLLVHGEPLTGDRQFWITRPYSRIRLLAAKALFVLAFVNAPLLLAEIAILAAAGYQPLAYLPNFLWMNLTFTGVVVFFPAAIAALTRTLVQFVLAVLGLFVGLILLSVVNATAMRGNVYQASGLAWAGGVFLLLLATVPASLVFILQLRTRNRLVSAGVGSALVILMLLVDEGVPRRLGAAVQSHMFRQTAALSVAAVLDTAAILPDAKQLDPAGVTVGVPLRILNIPAGETAAPEIVQLTLATPAGPHWSSAWITAASTEASVFQTDPSADGVFAWKQRAVVDRDFWQHARSGPLTARGDVYVMLFSRQDVHLHPNGETPVPGAGRCSVAHLNAAASLVNCLAPFHMPFSRIDQAAHSFLRLLSIWDSPLPSDFGMNPLFTNDASAGEQDIFFRRYDPRAFIHRSFTAAQASDTIPPGGYR